MTDTQWPRFIVFQQEKEGQPHQYDGSVHAPDAEMALMNARDVFVRRPACVSLWVVPADSVFAKTAEQLADNPLRQERTDGTNESAMTYMIFQKVVHKGTYVHAGDVSASTPDLALSAAFESVVKRSALAWWVFPASAITRSTPEDIEVLFQPALNKDFRDQAFYHTVAAMQQIRTRSQDDSTDEP